MRMYFANRSLILVAILSGLSLLPACGQKNAPSSGAADTPETRAAIQTALIEDAAVEGQILDAVALSSAMPNADQFPSNSLSVVLCFLASPWQLDESAENLQKDIALVDPDMPNPAKIAQALMRNRLGDKYSVISKDGIKDLTCNITGDQAQGNVKFRFGDVFTANVQYRAEQKESKWRITEFRLPNWDIKLVRDDKQNWIATGLGVKRMPLVVPKVAGIPVRDLATPRLRVNIGPNPKSETYPPPADDPVVFEGDRITKLADFQKALPAAIKAFEKEHQTFGKEIALVLYADRRTPWGRLEQFMRVAAAAGIKDFRLVAESDNPLGNPGDWVSTGEFQIQVPRVLPAVVAEVEPIDFSHKIRIYPGPDGTIKMIAARENSFPNEKNFSEWFRKIAAATGDLPLADISAEPALQYGELLKVMSAMGELKAAKNSDIKTFVPLYKTSQLENPNAEIEKLELSIDPNELTSPEMVLDPSAITTPNAIAVEEISVPEINVPGAVGDPDMKVETELNTLPKLGAGLSGAGGTGIGLGSGVKKPPTPKEPKKSP